MSHHHLLMPIVYTPEVKPKKIAPKKNRVLMRAAGSVEATGQTEEIFEASGFGQPAPGASKLQLENFMPIEGAEQKPQQPLGRLSDNTLKMMLQAQESKLSLA